MSIKGYHILDGNGHLLEKIEGTVDRRVLNKHRLKGRRVKKIFHDDK